MNDTIFRQAAIDALGEKPLAWTEGEYETGLQNQWEADVDAIKAVPSAQPEIIRCKDCKEFRRWINTDITFCDKTESEVKEYDFCSRAERKTDE